MPAVFPRSDPVVKAKTPSCHDCWCILVFGLVLAGMVCLTLWATIKEGAHIQRLIHPVDYAGRMCGISPGVQDKPFIYVCGKASAGFEGDYPSQLDLHSKTCVAACPSLGGDVACIGRPLVTPKALDCQDNGCVVNGIQVRKTVTWQISQAVTYQKAYPTDEFRGMICAPKWEAPNDLRSQVLFGDASPLSSAGEAFGSLETAWPVLLAVFGIATLLSILVLLCMTCYAGPVLFMAILLADIMVFILGIFFAIGLFFDPYNTAGWYQSWNPIDRTVYGEWARVLTFFTGLFFLVVGVLLTHTLLHASERLDEPIGMIHASMEFIFDPGPSHSSIPFLILVPFGNSLLTLALLAASIYCLMLVLTAGPVDGKGIVIDGEHYPSLYKGVQKPWNGLGWDIAMVVFVAGIIWILELMIGVGQYVISHCVCEWFFQPIDEIAPLEMKKQKEELASTNPEVKRTSLDKVHIVGGAAAGVHKEGYIEHDQETGQKKMVVYLRDKGPNDKPNVPTIIESKKHQIGWVCTGFCHAMTYKLGTLLYFSWYVFFTRPLRVTAEVLRFMATDPTIKLKREQFDEETDEQGWWKVIANGSSLFCTYVTHEFGGYSKDAYVDVILQDTKFRQASQDAANQILSAGGVISFLHGMTRFYEIVATLFIMLTSTILGFVVMENLPAFSDTNSGWYISDTTAMALVCLIISGVVANSWMSLFNTTSDSLLYVLMWARKMAPNDPEFPAVTRAQAQKRGTPKVCPDALLDLVGAEAEVDPVREMHEHTKHRSQATRFAHLGSRWKGAAMATFAPGVTTNREERDPLLRKPKGSTRMTAQR